MTFYNHMYKSRLPHLHPWDHYVKVTKEKSNPMRAHYGIPLMMLHKGIKTFSGQGILYYIVIG